MTLRERLLKALEFKNVDGNNHDFERGRQNQCASRREIDAALADVVEALERAGVDMGNAAASNVRFRIQALERIDNAIAKLEGVLKEMGK